jgi:hypothetical protein
MDEKMTTIGCVMGLEADHHQGSTFDALQKYVLLMFCPTGESDHGTLETTARMLDLVQMGLRPVAVAKCNPDGIFQFSICAFDGVSDVLRSAVIDDAGKIVLDALEGLQDTKYDRREATTNHS